MIVVGENLKALILGNSMCPSDQFDETSITLKLDSTVFRPIDNQSSVVRYGTHSVESFYKEEVLKDGELTLDSGQCVLACSSARIFMPMGYMGLVQTKGTLARLFVMAHCSDSQVEPGFRGKITLELINLSSLKIVIPVGSPVAQLFIARCSTDNCRPYAGKYVDSDLPTLPLPFA